MYTYIKKEIIGNYIDSEIPIDALNGYETSVGASWEDYLDGKFLLLSMEQIAFHREFPDLPVENVWFMTHPSIIERTLEDAKSELHAELDEYANTLKVIYLNGRPVWLDDRPSLKLQVDAESAYNSESVILYVDGNEYHVPVDRANDAILAAEHYNTQLTDFIANLHSQIDTIPSIEFADSIVITDFITDVPSAPSFTVDENTEPLEPEVPTYSYMFMSKLNNCYAHPVPEGFNDGDAFAITVYPNDGCSLYRSDFVCEVNGLMAGTITFEDDFFGRSEYASVAHISADNINGDVFVAGNAHMDQAPKEVQATVNKGGSHLIIFKLSECYSENPDAYVADGDAYSTRIVPNPNHIINRDDTICEMGGVPVKVRFKDDQYERDEFAYAIHIDIPAVTDDLFISAVAYTDNHE